MVWFLCSKINGELRIESKFIFLHYITDPLALLAIFKSSLVFVQLFFTPCIFYLVFDILASLMLVLQFSSCMHATSIESMFSLIILSAVVSGIPSSAWPFLGTGKEFTLLLEVSWYSLEQYIGCMIRQAFNYYCSLLQV